MVDIAVGTVIDERYKVLEQLGSGGMGTVYKAWDLEDGQDVALKTLNHAVNREEVRRRFQREFHLLSKIEHPHIVRPHEWGLFDGRPYFSMAYLPGQMLSEKLEDATSRDALRGSWFFMLVRQVGEALAYVHKQGMVHRDLKPSNIMVCEVDDGISATILDLGLSRFRGPSDMGLTQSGDAVGTVEYMSPEQAKGVWVDQRSDLYSLGVTLYEVLTGRPPFSGNGAVSVIMRHIRDAPPLPRDLNPQVSEPVQKILLKLLEKEPIDRYQSVEEFLRDVNEIEPRGTLVAEPEERYTAKPVMRALRPQFVGREKEMKVLRELLSEASAGTPCMPLISGDAGMGKSWLVEQLQGDARIYGMQLLKGACYETGGRAYGPLIEAFQRSNGLRPPVLFSNGAEPSELERADRFAVMEEVAEFIKRLAKMQPVLLCIEDVQWIDELTLEFLKMMQRDPESVPLMVCLTSRNTESGDLPDHLNGWADDKHQVVLRGVTLEETGYLAASTLGERQVPADVTQALYDETKGNPFHVVEVMQSFLAQEVVVRGDDDAWVWHPIPEKLTPKRISEVLIQRIDGLEKKHRRVLEYASVLRGTFSFDVLAHMWQGSELDLLETLEDLVAAGVLESEKDRSDRYRFTHGLFQETLYNELSDLKAPILHKEAGRALESLSDEDDSDVLDDLAYHFARSTDNDRAFYYLRRAGKKALLAYAFVRAHELFEAAAKKRDLEQDNVDDVGFLCDYANTLHARGQNDAALAQIEKALAFASEDMQEEKARILHARGTIYITLRKYLEAETALLKAVGFWQELGNVEEELTTLVRLPVVYDGLGQVEKAIDYNRLVAQRYEELGGELYKAKAEKHLGYAAYVEHRFGDARTLLESAYARLLEIDNRTDLHSCLSLLAQSVFYCGDFKYSIEIYGDLCNVWSKRGVRSIEALSLYFIAESSYLSGNLDKAFASGEEAHRIFTEIGDQNRLYRTRILLAKTTAQRGQIKESLSWVERAQAGTEVPGETPTVVWRGMAISFAIAGRIEEAEKAFEQAIECYKGFGGGEWAQSVLAAGQFYVERKNWVVARERLETAKHAFAQMNTPYFEQAAADLLAQVPENLQAVAPEDAEAPAFTPDNVTVFYEVCRDLTSELDLNRLLDRTLERLLGVTRAERALVALKNDSSEMFHVEVARAHNLQDTAVEEISQGVIRQVIEANEPVMSLDARSDERFEMQQSVIAFGIRAVICVPLYHAELGIIGALYADHRRIESAFSDADKQLLAAFGDLVSIAIVNAKAYSQLQDQARHLQEQVESRNGFGELVGNSSAMQPVYSLIESAAASDIAVLVLGETGTGKELAARAIHYNSARKDHPMLSQNCAALPSELLQSELFGHKRGAYTGAASDRAGLFEAADGGTVFLDEIADASPEVQSNLLRVLQEGEIRRLGENMPRNVNVRIIAATNKDLEAEVEAGNFREDLLYRLRVLQIDMPPLRAHVEDIPQLAEHLMKKELEVTPKVIDGMSGEAVQALMDYAWPGNVRELENEIKRAVALADVGGQITPFNFSNAVQSQMRLEPGVYVQKDLKARVGAKEKQIIEDALDEYHGNVTRTASHLGLSRSGLYKKLSQYGLRE